MINQDLPKKIISALEKEEFKEFFELLNSAFLPEDCKYINTELLKSLEVPTRIPHLIPIINLYPIVAPKLQQYCIDKKLDTNTIAKDHGLMSINILYILLRDEQAKVRGIGDDANFINGCINRSQVFWKYYLAHLPIEGRLAYLETNYYTNIHTIIFSIATSIPYDLSFLKQYLRQIKDNAPGYYNKIVSNSYKELASFFRMAKKVNKKNATTNR